MQNGWLEQRSRLLILWIQSLLWNLKDTLQIMCRRLEFVLYRKLLASLSPSRPLSLVHPSLPLASSVCVSLHSAQIDGGCWLRAQRGKARVNLSLPTACIRRCSRCTVGCVGVRGGAQLTLLQESIAAVGDMNGNELWLMSNVLDTLSSVWLIGLEARHWCTCMFFLCGRSLLCCKVHFDEPVLLYLWLQTRTHTHKCQLYEEGSVGSLIVMSRDLLFYL